LNAGQLISLIYLASGLILFMLAVIIVRENPGNRLNRVVAMMLFFAGVAPFVAAIYKSVLESITGLPPWFVNTYYVWEFFFPALLYFSVIFPEPQPFYLKHKRLLQLAFLPHFFHLLLVLLLAEPDKLLGLLNLESQIPILSQLLMFISGILKLVAAILGFLLLIHTRFFSLVDLIYVGFALYFLQMGYKNIENPRLKEQMKLVIKGIWVAMGFYVIGFLIPEILGFRIPESLRDLMVVATLIVGPGTIAWAIVRYQFLDIGLIARRSLVYTITTAVVVGGYLMMVMQLGSLIRSIIGQESQILNVLVIIVLLMFFQPIYTQVDDFVRKIFIRTRADYSYLVESFSRQILAIFQADKLAATVADMLKREMFIENVEVSYPDGNGRFGITMPGRERATFDLEPEISNYLLAKIVPTFTEEFGSRAARESLGAEMIARGVQLVVPLVRHEKLAGLLMLSSKVAGFRYSSEDLTFLSILANQILVAMENSELYIEALEKQRLEEELSVAKQIQTGLLPKTLPESKMFDFAAYIEPSRQVGGDFYDFISIGDSRLGIVMADASGKGVPAALLIARMQAVIQSEARLGKGVDRIMASVNHFISNSTSPDRFATCFYAELDEQARRLHYCNAGHNYPLLVKNNGEIVSLVTGGLLLGAFPHATYEAGMVEISPGDTLVIYTDGLTEMMDSAEQEYGEKRLIDCARILRAHPAELICSGLIESVKNYGSGPNEIDDMTLVVMKARE
jgi:sigma-B regulation protein RsbU (phosphoserine phosphatase)